MTGAGDVRDVPAAGHRQVRGALRHPQGARGAGPRPGGAGLLAGLRRRTRDVRVRSVRRGQRAAVAGGRGDLPRPAGSGRPPARRRPPSDAARPGQPAELGRQGQPRAACSRSRDRDAVEPSTGVRAGASAGSRRDGSSGRPPRWCLAYPDDELLGRSRSASGGARRVPRRHRRADFAELLDDAGSTTPLASMQADYVEIFDLSRKHTLYLSYWTDGDTRRRGEVLAGQAALPRAAASWSTPTASCPTTCRWCLEYAAMVGPDRRRRRCCRSYRASLELLRLGPARDAAPAYAGVLEAVCATLPGASPADRQAVHARWPRPGRRAKPSGLDPYDPRLLPVRRTVRRDERAAVGRAALPHAGGPGRRHRSGATATTSSAGPPVLPAVRVPAAADRLPAVPLRHPVRDRRPHRRPGRSRWPGPRRSGSARSSTTSMPCSSAAIAGCLHAGRHRDPDLPPAHHRTGVHGHHQERQGHVRRAGRRDRRSGCGPR